MDLKNFDPNNTGSTESGIFGIPTSLTASKLALIPVPWEVTTSYGSGTSEGPETIFAASPQIDLFDIEFEEAWRSGFHWMEPSLELKILNGKLKPLAQEIIRQREEGESLTGEQAKKLDDINQGCKQMVWNVYNQAQTLLNQNKLVAVVGGDHSSPEGLIQALCDKYNGQFGILHIDAHCDLRVSYQGFEHSHASIMFNAMNHKTPPKKLVQVGIRDFSREEYDYSQKHPNIQTFWDRQLKKTLAQGQTWSEACREIIASLPENVYVSFDIDGLSPEFCPHTGTPVPGGLSFDQATYLLSALGRSGKKIVGFDLNEVAPDPTGQSEWDGNVGARILYLLCGWCVSSNQ